MSETKTSQAPRAFTRGDIIAGRYEIERKLGEGGMGVVWQARQLGLNRRVVIKTTHPRLEQKPELIARFRREASVFRELNHPNTVRIYDFGESESGQLFLVMEYIEGHPLSEVLEQRGQLPLELVGHIGRQVLKSLIEAHAHGVIHRDIKPNNLMLCRQLGETNLVKLLDFGLAQADDRDQSFHTTSGLVMGTPHYMSPEQALGNPTDARSDLYSLGITLFELATGAPPYLEKSPLQVAMRHVDPVPLSIPPWLDKTHLGRVIARATQKDPAKRYPDAAHMLADLTKNELGSLEGAHTATDLDLLAQDSHAYDETLPRMHSAATASPTITHLESSELRPTIPELLLPDLEDTLTPTDTEDLPKQVLEASAIPSPPATRKGFRPKTILIAVSLAGLAALLSLLLPAILSPPTPTGQTTEDSSAPQHAQALDRQDDPARALTDDTTRTTALAGDQLAGIQQSSPRDDTATSSTAVPHQELGATDDLLEPRSPVDGGPVKPDGPDSELLALVEQTDNDWSLVELVTNYAVPYIEVLDAELAERLWVSFVARPPPGFNVRRVEYFEHLRATIPDHVRDNLAMQNTGVDDIIDSDFDGLLDIEELRLGTDPFNPDTDGDGLSDRWEHVSAGFDPTRADTLGDGVSDLIRAGLAIDGLRNDWETNYAEAIIYQDSSGLLPAACPSWLSLERHALTRRGSRIYGFFEGLPLEPEELWEADDVMVAFLALRGLERPDLAVVHQVSEQMAWVVDLNRQTLFQDSELRIDDSFAEFSFRLPPPASRAQVSYLIVSFVLDHEGRVTICDASDEYSLERF